MKIAFIGLGVMGSRIAAHLSAENFDVHVYNRSREKSEKWLKDHKGKFAATPKEACKDADLCFCCVTDGPDVESVVLGDNGAIFGIKKGGIIVDHTTTSAEISRNIYEKAIRRHVFFLHAPVSGGEVGAKEGTLTIMCGGDKEAFNKSKQFFKIYAREYQLIGPAGSGQLSKMVNQICIAGVIQSLSEGLHFGVRQGLDMKKVISVISKGAAQSWQMENRAYSMLENKFNFGFAVDLMRKDLRICIEHARLDKISLPVTSLVDQFYNELQLMGHGRSDTSSLAARFSDVK